MSNAERCRRLAERAGKDGAAVAPGHELLFNLDFVFDPMLLREVRGQPGLVFAWNGVPVVGKAPLGRDPMTASVVDLAAGRTLYNPQLRQLEQPFVRDLTTAHRPEIERHHYY